MRLIWLSIGVDQLNTYATDFVRVHIAVLPGIRRSDICANVRGNEPCSAEKRRCSRLYRMSQPTIAVLLGVEGNELIEHSFLLAIQIFRS